MKKNKNDPQIIQKNIDDLKPYYAGLIIDRWEQYTDRKAEKVN